MLVMNAPAEDCMAFWYSLNVVSHKQNIINQPAGISNKGNGSTISKDFNIKQLSIITKIKKLYLK
jgi:hypothetical protein